MQFVISHYTKQWSQTKNKTKHVTNILISPLFEGKRTKILLLIIINYYKRGVTLKLLSVRLISPFFPFFVMGSLSINRLRRSIELGLLFTRNLYICFLFLFLLSHPSYSLFCLFLISTNIQYIYIYKEEQQKP